MCHKKNLRIETIKIVFFQNLRQSLVYLPVRVVEAVVRVNPVVGVVNGEDCWSGELSGALVTVDYQAVSRGLKCKKTDF